MNEEWKSFLQGQGAVLDGGHVSHFGNPAVEIQAAKDRTILADLSHLALLRAHGPDAQSFLNSQLSNDLRLLDDAHSQLNSYCSAKGRMLAVFRVFRRDSDYLLQLPASLREDMLKRLRMFVMRAKVTIEDAGNELSRFGLSGPEANKILRNAIGFVADGADACVTRDSTTVANLPGPHRRYEIIAPSAQAAELWKKLKSGTVISGSGAWAWLDMMAGIPVVYPQTSEAFVPQMANLELVGGVNFKKGCYPGQEIVARMQYLGKLKQRMYRVHVITSTPPQPGDAIYAPGFPGQSAGTVVDAQPSPEGGHDLLAVIQISSAEAGELHLGSEMGPRLSKQPLPYLFPGIAGP